MFAPHDFFLQITLIRNHARNPYKSINFLTANKGSSGRILQFFEVRKGSKEIWNRSAKTIIV